jgi:hypothetical protein
MFRKTREEILLLARKLDGRNSACMRDNEGECIEVARVFIMGVLNLQRQG